MPNDRPAIAALSALILLQLVMLSALYAGIGAQAMRVLQQNGSMWLERGCGATLLVLSAALASYRRA